MKKPPSLVWIPILWLVVLFFLLYSFGMEIRRRHVEKRILPLVRKYSRLYRVDPYFVLAVISVESNFHIEARGRYGEYGLMQIMPHNLRRGVKELR
ncbi:MAG: hypothetical protein D6785_14325, partial [Planctomycetota bacterium]